MTAPISPDDPVARAVRQLAELNAACIDASSMIVCNKAGILDDLAACCKLHTVADVLAETGYHDAPVSVAPPAAAPDPPPGLDGPAAPDDRLLHAALRAQLPLISEDRELLLRFAASGLPYFNALMMLEYLLLRGRLSSRDYPRAARLLRRASRYSDTVLAFAQDVHLEVLKRL